MSKILQLFNDRHGESKVYRRSSVNLSHGVEEMRKTGDGHPLHYEYPDRTSDAPSPANDVVLGGFRLGGPSEFIRGAGGHGSRESLFRDVDRIDKFQKTLVGQRFLSNQILLQQANPWVQTRIYRSTNIQDHVNPETHHPRHDAEGTIPAFLELGTTLSRGGLRRRGREYKANTINIPGEFAFPLNGGRLQEETVDKLISTSPAGPVLLRLRSMGGMLNDEGLTYIDVIASQTSANIAKRINSVFGGITDLVEGGRNRLFGAGELKSGRPELQFRYLEQIYETNRAVLSSFGDIKYGHLYLDLPENDSTITYYSTHVPDAGLTAEAGPMKPGLNLGLLNYVVLKPSRYDLINFSAARLFDRAQRGISSWAGGIVSGVIRGLFEGLGMNISSSAVDAIKGFGSRFLPRVQDIPLLRSLRRWSVDIDDVIGSINREVRGAFGPLKPVQLVPTNLLELYETPQEGLLKTFGARGQDWLRTPKEDAEKTRQLGLADATYKRYINDLSDYKIHQHGGELQGTNKRPSIGWDGDSLPINTGGEHGDAFKSNAEGWSYEAHPEGKRYYKDWQQVDLFNKNRGIFRDPDSDFDSDSIDVIMQVRGTENEEVRFRAFIEDISEKISPNYNENKYIGRYETFYTYDKVTRDVSFKLKLHAFSLEEHEGVLQKMAFLTSLAYPESTGDRLDTQGYLTPLITDLTIGALYVRQPCIVQSLSYNIEGDASWDIINQTPMTVNVSMDLRILDKRFYSYKDLKGTTNDRSMFRLYLNSEQGEHAGTFSSSNLLSDAVDEGMSAIKKGIGRRLRFLGG